MIVFIPWNDAEGKPLAMVRICPACRQPSVIGHGWRSRQAHDANNFATSILRAGVSLPALMKLLGHHNANMTLLYVEVTQQDLQREYQAALLHPRHCVPVPPALRSDAASGASADAAAVAAAIASALRLMDLYRQLQAPSGAEKQVSLLARRLGRIRSKFEKLSRRPDGEK